MPTWPQFEAIQVTDITTHHRDGKSTVLVRTNMHTGTHIDAPIHYWPTGKHLGEIPISDLYGTGLAIDRPALTNTLACFLLKDARGRAPHGGQDHAEDVVFLFTCWGHSNEQRVDREHD